MPRTSQSSASPILCWAAAVDDPRSRSACTLRGEPQPRGGQTISTSPPVVVVVDAKRFSLVERLEDLIIEDGEDSKEDHEEVVMDESGRQHGEHAGGDQRDNMSTADSISAVNLGKHDLSCLTAVQGIDRQQVDQSPEQVDPDHVE